MRIIHRSGIYRDRLNDQQTDNRDLDEDAALSYARVMRTGTRLRHTRSDPATTPTGPYQYAVYAHPDPDTGPAGPIRYAVIVDTPQGRLYADSDARGDAERAYELLVCRDAERVAGQVDDNGTPLIPYDICDVETVTAGAPTDLPATHPHQADAQLTASIRALSAAGLDTLDDRDATDTRRDTLAQLTEQLLWVSSPDAQRRTPRPGQFDGQPRVRYRPDRWISHQDDVYVDAENSLVWRLGGPYQSTVALPLTPAREALIDALDAKYRTARAWAHDYDIDPAAAQRLIGAGWDALDYHQACTVLTVRTVADADVLVSHSRQQRQQLGWTSITSASLKWPAADAARFAAAGIPLHTAADLHGAGYRTVDQVLAAAPPTFPTDATRIVVTEPHLLGRRPTHVFVDPAVATDWIAVRPRLWAGIDVHTAHGPRPAMFGQQWVLWDDGRLDTSPLCVRVKSTHPTLTDDDYPDIPRGGAQSSMVIEILAATGLAGAELAEAAQPYLHAATVTSVRRTQTPIDHGGAGTTVVAGHHTFVDSAGTRLGELWDQTVFDWVRGVDATSTYQAARTAADAQTMWAATMQEITADQPAPARRTPATRHALPEA